MQAEAGIEHGRMNGWMDVKLKQSDIHEQTQVPDTGKIGESSLKKYSSVGGKIVEVFVYVLNVNNYEHELQTFLASKRLNGWKKCDSLSL